MGARIRAAREARRLSQHELAARLTRIGLRLNQGQVGKTESGQRPIRVDEVWAFAHALETTAAELLFDAEDLDPAVLGLGLAIARADVEHEAAEREASRFREQHEQAERRATEARERLFELWTERDLLRPGPAVTHGPPTDDELSDDSVRDEMTEDER